jgi:outer membrane biosynthesis protein TonB
LLLFYIAITQSENEVQLHPKKEKRVKISLKEFKKQPPKPKKSFGETKTKPKPTPVAPPMPKGGQLKKIVQKPLPKYNPKKHKRKPKLNKPKPAPKKQQKHEFKKTQKLPPQNNKPLIELSKSNEHNITKAEIAPKKVVKKKEQNPLYSLLSEDHSSEEVEQTQKTKTASKGVMQNIKELYGDEFGKLTPGQQKYILDNQEIMRRITQQVLNRVARVNLPRDINVNATNVIEFKLHPDGSMSDFRFLKKSGVYILDETTKETIEYAYSKYPHPQETTLIRYNVFYNLARY